MKNTVTKMKYSVKQGGSRCQKKKIKKKKERKTSENGVKKQNRSRAQWKPQDYE